jgi:hypothetical protein
MKIVHCALNRLTDQSSRRRTSSLQNWLFRLAGDNKRGDLHLSIQIFLEILPFLPVRWRNFFSQREGLENGLENAGRLTIPPLFPTGPMRQAAT